ncbi:MAG: 30S ribosomal protein S21 [Candidatus Dojkabacteria bacterium]|nr:30S ribosomal protein S21 [Candidatus Dojkabacteria bacterium]
MSVVVNNSNIDLALRLLWREANKEGIFEKTEELRYYMSPSEIKHMKLRRLIRYKKRQRKMKKGIMQKRVVLHRRLLSKIH